MRDDIPQLLFESRANFREWLSKYAETNESVWLIFGKNKTVKTLKASEALEEALCFGWIDGQMLAIDDTKYIKYFTKRRPKSVWSVKNKKIVEALIEKGLMTELGYKAIEISKENGRWFERTEESDKGMVEDFKKLLLYSPAVYDAFIKLPPSTQLAEARYYNLYKDEIKRENALKDIIERLQTK